jgi:hypothetical protein
MGEIDENTLEKTPPSLSLRFFCLDRLNHRLVSPVAAADMVSCMRLCTLSGTFGDGSVNNSSEY